MYSSKHINVKGGNLFTIHDEPIYFHLNKYATVFLNFKDE